MFDSLSPSLPLLPPSLSLLPPSLPLLPPSLPLWQNPLFYIYVYLLPVPVFNLKLLLSSWQPILNSSDTSFVRTCSFLVIMIVTIHKSTVTTHGPRHGKYPSRSEVGTLLGLSVFDKIKYVNCLLLWTLHHLDPWTSTCVDDY